MLDNVFPAKIKAKKNTPEPNHKEGKIFDDGKDHPFRGLGRDAGGKKAAQHRKCHQRASRRQGPQRKTLFALQKVAEQRNGCKQLQHIAVFRKKRLNQFIP